MTELASNSSSGVLIGANGHCKVCGLLALLLVSAVAATMSAVLGGSGNPGGAYLPSFGHSLMSFLLSLLAVPLILVTGALFGILLLILAAIHLSRAVIEELRPTLVLRIAQQLSAQFEDPKEDLVSPKNDSARDRSAATTAPVVQNGWDDWDSLRDQRATAPYPDGSYDEVDEVDQADAVAAAPETLV